MSQPLQFKIKKSVEQLKKLHKGSKGKLQPRLQMLIILKKEGRGLSKNVLAERLGVNHNSIQQWRTDWKGGLNRLLSDKRGGNHPSIIKKGIHKAIGKKLRNATAAIRSYKELKEWIKENFGQSIKYTTLNGYVKRKFRAKLKVARKSHIKKDEQAVAAFKKNGSPYWRALSKKLYPI